MAASDGRPARDESDGPSELAVAVGAGAIEVTAEFDPIPVGAGSTPNLSAVSVASVESATCGSPSRAYRTAPITAAARTTTTTTAAPTSLRFPRAPERAGPDPVGGEGGGDVCVGPAGNPIPHSSAGEVQPESCPVMSTFRDHRRPGETQSRSIDPTATPDLMIRPEQHRERARATARAERPSVRRRPWGSRPVRPQTRPLGLPRRTVSEPESE